MGSFTRAHVASRDRTRRPVIGTASIDNGNGTLTTTIAQPNGRTVSRTVAGKIPDGDIRVQFGDDNYSPDKHFDARGAAAKLDRSVHMALG